VFLCLIVIAFIDGVFVVKVGAASIIILLTTLQTLTAFRTFKTIAQIFVTILTKIVIVLHPFVSTIVAYTIVGKKRFNFLCFCVFVFIRIAAYACMS